MREIVRYFLGGFCLHTCVGGFTDSSHPGGWQEERGGHEEEGGGPLQAGDAVGRPREGHGHQRQGEPPRDHQGVVGVHQEEGAAPSNASERGRYVSAERGVHIWLSPAEAWRL